MKRQIQTAEHPKGVDRDHFCFYDAEWSANADSRRLRNNTWLIGYLDREVHEAKHREVSLVPTLGRFVCNKVVREFSPVQGDHLASLDALIGTIEDVRGDRRLPLDERQYAEFTIDALARSRPFIQEGLVVVERHLRVV